MNIERIETLERFAALRGEWNTLLQTSSSDCVFLTHEWLFSWWKHLREQRTLSIITAREDGRLVGILPVALRSPQYTRMMPRTLEFLGSGVIGSDYLDIIVSPAHCNEVSKEFAEYLNRAGFLLQLTQLRRGEAAAARLAGHLEGAGWTVDESKMNVCPFINLMGHTWESYLATLSSSHRYNFNRRLRGLMKSAGMRVDCVQSPVAAQSALDVVMALHRERWGSTGASEAFQNDVVVAFHREFVDLAASRGWLRILILSVHETPAAALYALRYGRTFYFYQSGFDPAYSKQSAGLVAMGLAIKAAIEEGACEYDLLHGSEEYKFHWVRETRDLGRIEMYPPRARGRIYKHAIDVNRAARRMARRVLKKGV